MVDFWSRERQLFFRIEGRRGTFLPRLEVVYNVTGHLEESLATVLADKAKSITAKTTLEWDSFLPESVQKKICKYLYRIREVWKPLLEFVPLHFILGGVTRGSFRVKRRYSIRGLRILRIVN